MPKLIIKQEVGARPRRSGFAKWLSIGGLLILLITVATAAAYFTKKPFPEADLEPLTFKSAGVDTTGYQSLHAVLGDLMAEYEGVAERGVDDYQKNLMLSGKAESILRHLDKMGEVAEQLGLDEEEYKEVADRHQFYNDFWQAKRHFRELRISRFENKMPVNDAGDALDSMVLPGEQAEAADEQPAKKRKFQFAKPPEGMALPAGFCDLSNPGSCKVEDAEPALTSIEQGTESQPAQEPLFNTNATDVADEQPAKKRKFQFAKPPEGMELPAGFCDLSNPGSCKAEDAEPALTSIEQETESQPAQEPLFNTNATDVADEQPAKKRKFQFAKPPEGMALPAGFCDLSNPGSCKPEGDAATETVVQTIGDLPLPDEIQDESITANNNVAEQPKKRKFQFAKPPEGMALPAGFCDLNNPGSCKPEGDLLSDAEKPVLDAVAEPDDNKPKDQL